MQKKCQLQDQVHPNLSRYSTIDTKRVCDALRPVRVSPPACGGCCWRGRAATTAQDVRARPAPIVRRLLRSAPTWTHASLSESLDLALPDHADAPRWLKSLRVAG